MLLIGHTLPRSRFSSQVPHSFYESKTFYLNPSRGERDCTAILYPYWPKSFKKFYLFSTKIWLDRVEDVVC